MTKINNKRAKLLHDKFDSNAASSFTSMVKHILKTPSVTEEECCSGKITNHSIISLNIITLNNDYKNLVQAINDNYPKHLSCKQCKKSPKYKRTFEPQLLIEVKLRLAFFRVTVKNIFCISNSFLDFSMECKFYSSELRKYFVKCFG